MEEDAISPEEAGYVFISEEEGVEIREQIKQGGLVLVKKFLDNKLAQWKKQPLNVAITGNSGTGKSSFINAVRDMTPEDEGAAKVDVIESTTVPTPYAHPKNKGLNFWDLPGVGTPNYPHDSYLERVGFEKYDFFLILCANRFTENDLWLAKMVRSKGKKFFFVRTKIDQDMRNCKRSKPSSFDEIAVLKKISNDIIKHINEVEQQRFASSEVFLISNWDQEKWDFPRLCEQLILNLPQLKREAMALSLDTFSKEMVIEKKAILESRIWKVATISAAGAVIPFPGVSLTLDFALLIAETGLYKKQFGIDDESLSQLSKRMGRDENYLKQFMRESVSQLATKEGITQLLKMYSTSMTVEEAARYIPAGIGSILSGVISFSTTYKMLYAVLEQLEKEAKRVMEIAVKDSLSDVEE